MAGHGNHVQRDRAPTAALFTPLKLAELTLRNRLAVAPMTRVSATSEGNPAQRMSDYYAAFAEGGFGLVITEGLYTDKAYSQGYLFQPGLSDEAQGDGWRPIVERVHGHGARMIAQLMHAGALSQGSIYRKDTRGPSAVRPKGQQMAFYRGTGEYPMPVAMSRGEISEAVGGFAKAACLAKESGFDGVEIHGANGYLLDQFLTEGINLRDDRYGGDIEARLRLIAEVAQAVRDAVGPQFVVGVRISQGKVNDFVHKWSGSEDEAARIFGLVGRLPIDYLHTTEFEAWRPAFGAGASLAALAKKHVAIPVLANGSLHDPEQAAGLIESSEADFISLGRGALTHPDWPRRVTAGASLEAFDPGILSPIADLENADKHRAGIVPVAS
ncbi:NADH:flavin oxidoreductase [Bradyrhizobium sp. Leo121]|uniref:NADH:flavin oxidoreductase n=1 Tax=Bradyrhizobium sp. Leo121 TaxID=1571195 RepID=UPI00102A0370|nr:NADH:flavin oxidoreductase [Bradyrhizobium sp. Leo121]RZN22909.1 NADH:flavin oxidoreductase [Bradyrhizobium sp. Leo121]